MPLTTAPTNRPPLPWVSPADEPLLERATWEEYISLIQQPKNEHSQGFFYQGWMTIDMAAVGHDHAEDNSVLDVLVGIFCTLKFIPFKPLVNCTFRKTGQAEFQPDLAFYFGDRLRAIPRGTTIVDLDRYPVPDLVIEIANTSLNLDVGWKRLCYEGLGVGEYWVVDVSAQKIYALAILDSGSQHIRESRVLPGLNLDWIEAALIDGQTNDLSAACGEFMQRLGASLPRLDSSSS